MDIDEIKSTNYYGTLAKKSDYISYDGISENHFAKEIASIAQTNRGVPPLHCMVLMKRREILLSDHGQM